MSPFIPAGSVVGKPIASASTISPSSLIHHVTGGADIININPPHAGFIGAITLIFDGPGSPTFTAGFGNISLPLGRIFLQVGLAITLTFDGTLWYPIGHGA